MPVLKDEENELPVPTLWRRTFIEVVEAFKDGDFRLLRGVAGLRPISEMEADRIAGNIAAYGEKLISLPDGAWGTSVYLWMGDYWEVLIDLYTLGEGRSDLVLFVDVHEGSRGYCFEVTSVHVP